MTENENLQIRELAASGNKIEAIKRYRELTGTDLKTAKTAIESMDRVTASEEDATTPELRREVVLQLSNGEQIEAIRVYREATGVGLKVAQDRIRAIAQDEGIPLTSGGVGCFGAIILALGAACSLRALA